MCWYARALMTLSIPPASSFRVCRYVLNFSLDSGLFSPYDRPKAFFRFFRTALSFAAYHRTQLKNLASSPVYQYGTVSPTNGTQP